MEDYEIRRDRMFKRNLKIGAIGILLTLIFVVVCMISYPLYSVWQQGLEGHAILAKAEQTRQIQIIQATAEKEAAVQRAEAIKIVGQAAKDFPEYRLQEFVGAFAEALHNGKISQIIYVPTEGGIPILEATRMQHK